MIVRSWRSASSMPATVQRSASSPEDQRLACRPLDRTARQMSILNVSTRRRPRCMTARRNARTTRTPGCRMRSLSASLVVTFPSTIGGSRGVRTRRRRRLDRPRRRSSTDPRPRLLRSHDRCRREARSQPSTVPSAKPVSSSTTFRRTPVSLVWSSRAATIAPSSTSVRTHGSSCSSSTTRNTSGFAVKPSDGASARSSSRDDRSAHEI